jgi:hypothetical protein
LREHYEEKLYRVYVTNSIRGISRGESMVREYVELLDNRKSVEDNRNGNEIAADIINKLGLRFEE